MHVDVDDMANPSSCYDIFILRPLRPHVSRCNIRLSLYTSALNIAQILTLLSIAGISQFYRLINNDTFRQYIAHGLFYLVQ